ncbi:MAG: zf-TFIIB domain-containing protein [Myxococcales bacterium]|nr:zf-TFIIB domain-containing protein [Myxococcales bacterium]
MVQERRPCPSCPGLVLVTHTVEGGVEVDSCTRCKGVWFDRGELAKVFRLARSQTISLAAIDPKAPLLCPVCTPRILTEREPSAEDPEMLIHECFHCGGSWLDAKSWKRLYRLSREAARGANESAARVVVTVPGARPGAGAVRSKASTASTATPRQRLRQRYASHGPFAKNRKERPLSGSRLPFDHPWLNLGAPPVALLLALFLVTTGIGFPPAQIMIHELGHALPAWFSGRAALPLPIGFTTWKEDPSWFTIACLSFLIGIFLYRSIRERRPYGIVLGLILLLGQLYFSFVVSEYRSKMWIVAGGVIGELVISTFLILSFHNRLPDRIRWDFWRFVALVPATITYLSAMQLWIGVRNHTRSLPMGSIMGRPGDGSGDLERLFGEYGWAPQQLIRICLGLGFLGGLLILGNYTYQVLKWIVRRESTQSLEGPSESTR